MNIELISAPLQACSVDGPQRSIYAEYEFLMDGSCSIDPNGVNEEVFFFFFFFLVFVGVVLLLILLCSFRIPSNTNGVVRNRPFPSKGKHVIILLFLLVVFVLIFLLLSQRGVLIHRRGNSNQENICSL